jgi:hypothetical protein
MDYILLHLYVMLEFNGDDINANFVRVLTNKLTKLEKLQNDRLHA